MTNVHLVMAIFIGIGTVGLFLGAAMLVGHLLRRR